MNRLKNRIRPRPGATIQHAGTLVAALKQLWYEVDDSSKQLQCGMDLSYSDIAEAEIPLADLCPPPWMQLESG